MLWTMAAMAASLTVQSGRDEPGPYRSLLEVTAGCNDPALRLPSYRGIDYDRDYRRLLGAMLRVDPASCPGVASHAAREIVARVGEPERGDVDLDFLRLGHGATSAGPGADPALARRYGQMLWLFADRPPEVPGWTQAEREAWLIRPATVDLLVARNTDRRLRTRRSLEHEEGIRLRRDLPFYDPAIAVERLMVNPTHDRAMLDRSIRLLTSGEHVPPDYIRAARLYFRLGVSAGTGEGQSVLLDVGQRAAAAARSGREQSEALRILTAAALHGDAGAVAARDAFRARLRIARGRLTPEDAARIPPALDWRFGWVLPDRRAEDPATLNPIILRAVIGPDGRIATIAVRQSSGIADRDRDVMATWIEYAHRVDLGATAQGRFVEVDLPPVDPLMNTFRATQLHGREATQAAIAPEGY